MPVFSKCNEPDCPKAAQVRGYCRKHYEAYFKRTTDGTSLGNTGGKKCTEEQCIAIKRFYMNFNTRRATAKKFGISLPLLDKILSGKYEPKKESTDD